MLLFHKTGHPLPTFPPISSSTAGPHPPQVTEHGSRITGHGICPTRIAVLPLRKPPAPARRITSWALFRFLRRAPAPRGGTVGLQIKSVFQRLQRGLQTPTYRCGVSNE